MTKKKTAAPATATPVAKTAKPKAVKKTAAPAPAAPEPVAAPTATPVPDPDPAPAAAPDPVPVPADVHIKRAYVSKKKGFRLINKETGAVQEEIYNLRRWCDNTPGQEKNYMRLFLTLNGGKPVDGMILQRIEPVAAPADAVEPSVE